MIRFQTLGTLQLRTVDGRTLQSILAQPKRTALLAYLAVSPGEYHRRDTLLGLFWGEAETGRARHSLNQAIYALRSTLGAGMLVSRGSEEICLVSEGFWCDVAALQAALQAGRFEEALELFRGELLAGFFLSEAPEFERWLEGERRRLRDQVIAAAWQLAERDEAAGNGLGSAHWARRAAAIAPHDEISVRRLITLLDRLGDRPGALSAYEAFARPLADEYATEPSDETRELVERIRSVKPASSAAGSQPDPAEHSAVEVVRPSPPLAGQELPIPATPFIGRENEVAAVRRLLDDPESRLVTLIGPGGVGKTRLALHVAGQLRASFADGVHFAPLVSVGAAALLPTALATALHLSFTGERDPEEQTLDLLAGRDLLLVLDNFDHLIDAAGFVARLLERAPRVKLLVTSREALNIRGESLCCLLGLRFPSDPAAADPQDYDAVQLLVQTARRSRPELVFGPDDWRWIARICRLLEGLPLALELAAPWLRILSCEELCREIEQNFAFLEARLRDVPDRHRSLRAVFESSWNRLAEEERTAFLRLAVFRGGFRREGAVAMGVTEPLLLALLDRSMLRRLPSGRFEVLEVLRRFAEERLGSDRHALRDRHSAFHARFLAVQEPALATARQGEALAAIDDEIANLREGWRWAVGKGKSDEIASSLESLFVFYDVRGWHQEAEEAFAHAIAALEERTGRVADESRRHLLARLLARHGVVCLRLGRYEAARERLEHSLEIFRLLGDERESALTLDRLGVVLYNLGDDDEARRCQEESLAMRRALGDAQGVATSLNNLGSLAYALRDYAGARRLCEESLALQRQLGDTPGIVTSLQNLGFIALLLGEDTEAERLLEETLAVARQSGSDLLLARALHSLGNLASARGEFDRARRCFEHAFAAAIESGVAAVVVDSLVGLGVVLRELGEKERALELVVSALQHPGAEQGGRGVAEQLLVDLKSELPSAATERALARAKTGTLEEILEKLQVSPSRLRA